jgi:hypothetical protein
MLGIGVQSAGISPAGIGEVEPIGDLPLVTSGARFLDTNGKPVIDPSTGDFAKMPEVVQRVQIALSTELASSTGDQSLGVSKITKMDETFEARSKNAALAALRKMTDAGEIEVTSCTVTRDSAQRATRTVKFIDLSTGTEQTVQNRVL